MVSLHFTCSCEVCEVLRPEQWALKLTLNEPSNQTLYNGILLLAKDA